MLCVCVTQIWLGDGTRESGTAFKVHACRGCTSSHSRSLGVGVECPTLNIISKFQIEWLSGGKPTEHRWLAYGLLRKSRYITAHEIRSPIFRSSDYVIARAQDSRALAIGANGTAEQEARYCMKTKSKLCQYPEPQTLQP